MGTTAKPVSGVSAADEYGAHAFGISAARRACSPPLRIGSLSVSAPIQRGRAAAMMLCPIAQQRLLHGAQKVARTAAHGWRTLLIVLVWPQRRRGGRWRGRVGRVVLFGFLLHIDGLTFRSVGLRVAGWRSQAFCGTLAMWLGTAVGRLRRLANGMPCRGGSARWVCAGREPRSLGCCAALGNGRRLCHIPADIQAPGSVAERAFRRGDPLGLQDLPLSAGLAGADDRDLLTEVLDSGARSSPSVVHSEALPSTPSDSASMLRNVPSSSSREVSPVSLRPAGFLGDPGGDLFARISGRSRFDSSDR